MSIPAVQIITLLIIGFSICAAVILLPAYLFFLENMRKTIAGKFACACLLLALSGLQLYHFGYLLLGIGDLFDHRAYVLLLLIAPPTFYFFSRELLLPDPGWSVWQLLHVIPVALGFFLR